MSSNNLRNGIRRSINLTAMSWQTFPLLKVLSVRTIHTILPTRRNVKAVSTNLYIHSTTGNVLHRLSAWCADGPQCSVYGCSQSFADLSLGVARRNDSTTKLRYRSVTNEPFRQVAKRNLNRNANESTTSTRAWSSTTNPPSFRPIVRASERASAVQELQQSLYDTMRMVRKYAGPASNEQLAAYGSPQHWQLYGTETERSNSASCRLLAQSL